MHAAGILAGSPRQPGRADAGKPDLAAVRMSGELQIDGVEGRLVGEVRFVDQQDNQFLAGDGLQGEIDVGIAFPKGIQTA